MTGDAQIRMEVRKLGLNARASCKPVRRQTPARPCGARRSPCRSRRRGTQPNADVAGFVPSRSGSGSQVSVLGYAALMPGHSTTSSRCGAVFLRHSNIRCRCLSWVKTGSDNPSAGCLLCPDQRTSPGSTGMSVSCHKPTSARVFAVGTRVTSRPPPRSVRAAFPHTAPTSGIDGSMLPYASQHPVSRLSGSESGACLIGPHSPWSPPFAPPTPLRIAPLCLSASQLL
jgi:hypothetical protein